MKVFAEMSHPYYRSGIGEVTAVVVAVSIGLFAHKAPVPVRHAHLLDDGMESRIGIQDIVYVAKRPVEGCLTKIGVRIGRHPMLFSGIQPEKNAVFVGLCVFLNDPA